MPTLVIHAPHSQVQQNQKQSFNQTIATGKGDGYAIWQSLFQQLSPGDEVVVICKVHQKQAVGRIKELKPTEKTETGMQRYDVIMADLKPVPYTHGSTAFPNPVRLTCYLLRKQSAQRLAAVRKDSSHSSVRLFSIRYNHCDHGPDRQEFSRAGRLP